MKEQVVILHGIGRSAFLMRKLARYLETQGYLVHNLSYPSTEMPMHELITLVRDMIRDAIDTKLTTHFVGFSMGGLMVRGVLNGWRPETLGRVVLMGTPNHGSEVADFVRHWWFYTKYYGPAGQELTTDSAPSVAALLGTPDYPCGVMAGNRSLDPLCFWLFDSPNDGKVSVESTKLAGMTDHIVLPTTHIGFPYHSKAHEQTKHFLQHGRFGKRET